MSSEETTRSEEIDRLREFCREIAIGATEVLKRHPGCGAVARLALALQRCPVSVPAVDVRRHIEDAKEEAYAEVHALTAEVAALRARCAELEQPQLFALNTLSVPGSSGEAR